MKMKKLLHGALALALTVALIVSSLVFAQAADASREVDTYDELQQAIIDNVSEIIINTDINATGTVWGSGISGKTITFKGTGNIILSNNNDNCSVKIFGNSNTVVFDGPGVKVPDGNTGNRAIVIWRESGSTSNNVTIKQGDFVGAVQAQGGSNLTVEGGTFTLKSGQNSSGALEVRSSATLNVKNATVIAEKGQAIYNNGGGTLNVSSSTITASGNHAIMITAGTSTILNVTVTSTGSEDFARVAAGATLDLNHVTVNHNASTPLFNAIGTINVAGGTYTVADTSKITNSGQTSNLNIYFGNFNFNPTSYAESGYTVSGSGSSWVVKGQTVESFDALQTAIKNNVREIIINTNINATGTVWGSGISNKNITFSGTGNIILASNSSSCEFKLFGINNTVVFDGPGVKVPDGNTANRAIVIWRESSGTNNTVLIKQGNFSGAIQSQEGGNLTVEGGTFTHKSTATGNAALEVRANASLNIKNATVISEKGNGIYSIGGSLNVSDTTITASGNHAIMITSGTATFTDVTVNSTAGDGARVESAATLNLNNVTFNHQRDTLLFDAIGKVNVNGGTYTISNTNKVVSDSYKGNLSISGGRFNFNPSDYVISGYEATLSNGIYTVDVIGVPFIEVYNFEELQAAIEKNIPEIIINTDINVTGTVWGYISNKNITFTGTGNIILASNSSSCEFKIFGINNTVVFDGPGVKVPDSNTANRAIVIWRSESGANNTVVIKQGNFVGAIQAQEGADLTVEGGTFTLKSGQNSNAPLEVRPNASLNVKNATVIAEKGQAVYSTGGTLNVSDSTITASGNHAIMIASGTATFTDVTVNSTAGDGARVESAATLNLNNVTINHSVATSLFDAIGTINVAGGTYTVADTSKITNSNQTSNLKITAGTFNFDPTAYINTDEYEVTAGNGTWTVSLAKVIVDDFAALKQAIADNVPEIVINKEITATGRIDAMEDKNIKFTGEGTVKFTGTTDATGGFHMRGGCNIVFDGPNFIVENNASRLLVIYQSGSYAAPNVTINKGTFTGEIQAQYKTILTINGGTFNTKNSNSYKNSVKLTTGEAVIINGGQFNATGSGSNAVSVAHDSDTSGQLTVMGGEFNASNGATAFYVNTSTVNSHSISNAVINVESGSTAINVGTGKTVTLKRVTVTNAGTFKAGSGTLNVVSGTYNFDPKDYVNKDVSDTNKDGANYIVTRKAGTPKMLRLTNGYNMNFSGYNFAAEATITAGQTYIFEIDYREFGGAGGLMFDLCYATTANGYNNGANKITPSEIDAVDGRYYRIEFTAPQGLRASSNFRLRIGQETLQLGTKDANGTLTNTYNYSTTIYVANVKLVNVNDTAENLIENGDFGYTPIGNITKDTTIEGWTLYGIDNLTSVDVMNIPNGFFTVDDVADLVNEFDTAIVLQGGDRHTLQFKANLKPNTSYKFSYYYRSVGDLPKFEIRTDYNRIDIQDVTTNGAKDYFEKTYVITPGELANGKGHTRNRFCFELGHNSTDAVFYIAGLKLYELDAQGNPIGENIIGDYNPIFIDDYDFSAGNIVKQQLGQGDNEMMTNIVAHGWLGNFHKSSDGYNPNYKEEEETNPDAVHAGSNKYAGVAKVADNFFVYRAPGLYIRDGIFGKLSYDTAYDVYLDAKYDVLDLLIAKMEKMDYFGADFQTEILKNEIVNAKDDASIQQGTIYKVANGQSLSTALSNARSGDTVLLARGGVWRTSSTLTVKSGVNLGAYGTGAKPQILGSQNYVGNKWSKDSGNIWRMSFSGSLKTMGNVFIYKTAQSTTPEIIGHKTNNADPDNIVLFTSKSQLAKEGDIYVGGGYIYLYTLDPVTKLTVDPDTYNRIEISGDEIVLELGGSNTVENIAVFFGGRHGIASGSSNLTVRNCEIAYIGGSFNEKALLGNGIEFRQQGSNLVAEHNYVHDCYDTGITFQAWNGYGQFKNITFKNNLLTNNFYNIEFWSDASGSVMQDIYIEENILKDAGYCWSYEQRLSAGNNKHFASNIYVGKSKAYYAGLSNLNIKNNTFDNTRANQICWSWAESTSGTYGSRPAALTASGNVFYQETGAFEQQVQLFSETKSFDFASSQGKFAEVMKVFDSTAFARWVVVNK